MIDATLLAEHPFSVTDLGLTTYSDRPATLKALQAVERGIGFGYPLCCVEEFAVDVLEGRLPALRRGSVRLELGGRYVPCSGCCEQMGRVMLG